MISIPLVLPFLLWYFHVKISIIEKIVEIRTKPIIASPTPAAMKTPDVLSTMS